MIYWNVLKFESLSKSQTTIQFTKMISNNLARTIWRV